MEKKFEVVVVGAGVVGLSCAFELQKAGIKTLVIDRGQVGMGCSYGNAGWITPCFAMPLPQPGMFLKSLTWLLNPESPLYIEPRLSYSLFRWLLEFLSHMNEKKMRSSISALTDISKESLNFYSEFASKKNGFGFEQKGLLMVSAEKSGLVAAEQEMDLMAEKGISGRKLSKEEVLFMEPTLKDGILGGVFFNHEAHLEPYDVVKELEKNFLELGGNTLGGCELYDVEFQDGKITRLMTTRGDVAANHFVLAAGSWSKNLSKKLKTRVPILGGKGYSMVVSNERFKPNHPVMIVEKKIAITPRKDSVRIAGTLELVDQNFEINVKRVDAVFNGACQYLKLDKNEKKFEIWRGLRPCTPDGVPMIGPSKKWKNLHFCTGHQMLGLQSAPGSAKLFKQIFLGEKTYTDPRPFSPERF